MNCGEIYEDMIYDRSYSCFEKGCLSNGQTLMGNGGFYGCLSEPQGVEGGRKQHKMIRFFSFLVAESPLTSMQSSKAKLLLPIMPIGIVAYAFTLVGQPLSKQLYTHNLRITAMINHAFKYFSQGQIYHLSLHHLRDHEFETLQALLFSDLKFTIA